jgi:hypothetical protein
MVEHISKDIRRLKQQADNREREEVMHHLEDQGSSERDHQQWQSDNRLSIATYNIPMHRFLQRTESLISSSSGASRDVSMVITDLDPVDDDEDSISQTVLAASDEQSPGALSDTEEPKIDKLFGEAAISSRQESDDDHLEYHALSTHTVPILSGEVGNGDRTPVTEASALTPGTENCLAAVDDSSIPMYVRDTSFPFYVRALFDYEDSNNVSHLSLRKGDLVQVFARTETGWYEGSVGDRRGWFPSSYCIEQFGSEELENVQAWKQASWSKSDEKDTTPTDSENATRAILKPPQDVPSSVSLKCDIRPTMNLRPPRLVGASKTILGDKLYVFGGRICDAPDPTLSSSLWELDLKTLYWTRVQMKGDIPPPRYFHTLCPWGESKLVCYGGLSSSPVMGSVTDEANAVAKETEKRPEVNPMSDIHIFDTINLTWTEVICPNPPKDRFAHLATMLETPANNPAEFPASKAYPTRLEKRNDMRDRGDEMVVVGGQDADELYIEHGSLFAMQDLQWKPGGFIASGYGMYRGFMAPLDPTFAENIKIKAPKRNYSAGKTSSLARSCALLFKNYNFLDLIVDVKVRFANGTWTKNLTSTDGTGRGLRFANGGVMGPFMAVGGIYITSELPKFGISIFDLRSLTWATFNSRGEPDGLDLSLQRLATLAEGSWNGGLVWDKGDAFVLLGDRTGDQLDDYNHRRSCFEDIAVIRLDDVGD